MESLPVTEDAEDDSSGTTTKAPLPRWFMAAGVVAILLVVAAVILLSSISRERPDVPGRDSCRIQAEAKVTERGNGRADAIDDYVDGCVRSLPRAEPRR